MAAHQLDLPAQHRRHALRDVLMRRAVEAVLFHAVLPATPPGTPYSRAYSGMVAWNSGSNAATIGTPGMASLECLDGRQVDRVVRGRGGQELPQRRHHIVVHHERPAILRTGMHGLQRHGIDRACRRCEICAMASR